MTTSVSSLLSGINREFDFIVSHLSQKTTSFEISQCGTGQPSYSPSYMTEIFGNMLIKNQKAAQMCNNNSVNSIETNKVGHILENSLGVKTYFINSMGYIYYWKSKTIIQVVFRFPCLLGHSVCRCEGCQSSWSRF